MFSFLAPLSPIATTAAAITSPFTSTQPDQHQQRSQYSRAMPLDAPEPPRSAASSILVHVCGQVYRLDSRIKLVRSLRRRVEMVGALETVANGGVLQRKMRHRGDWMSILDGGGEVCKKRW
ncbi:hypothetical protein BDZ91DRAFT_22041 [Kalaharituber pfeilii]|nr:hypothetical protein BDZ91DRAFT_22041 [Kalaharituber pfeilii]